MVRFACPTCGCIIRAQDDQAGQKLECPKCTQRIQIPTQTEQEPPGELKKTVLGSLFPNDSAQMQGSDATGEPSAPPDPMTAEWFYESSGQKIGPVSFEQLRALANSGDIGSRTPIWTIGMGVWLPASKVGALRSAFPSFGSRKWALAKWRQFRSLSQTRQGLTTAAIAAAVVAIAVFIGALWRLETERQAAEKRAEAERGIAASLRERIKTALDHADSERAIAARLKQDIDAANEYAVKQAAKLRGDARTAEEKAKIEQAVAEQLARDLKTAQERAAASKKIAEDLRNKIESAEEKANLEIKKLREKADGAAPGETKKILESLQQELDAAKAAAAKEKGKLTGATVYQRLVHSTVWILVEDAGGLIHESGSGVLVNREDGLIVTNYHVVRFKGKVKKRVIVSFPMVRDGKVLTSPAECLRLVRADYENHVADVVETAPSKDLALIRLRKIPGNQAVRVADTSVQPGMHVHSIGNPAASDALWVYTSGTVRTAPHVKKWQAPDGFTVLRFEATIIETQSPTNPGDSGGPLVNDQGDLVGITQGFATRARDHSYFIDLSEVTAFVSSFSSNR